MSHQIFGQGQNARFMDAKQVAWHRLGVVADKPMLAQEALLAIKGDYHVELRPMHYELNGYACPVDSQQIVRYPTKDDNVYVPFGTVGPGYELITPSEIAELFDKAVGKPIETLGVLQRGALLFITTQLPTMDVKGDEVERYLGITNPMDGKRTASAEEWPLRVVCANTLRAAQASAHVSYRVVHDGTAKERLTTWLKVAYDQALRNYENAREAFSSLAETNLKDSQAKAIFNKVYPFPRVPRENAPKEVMQQRINAFLVAKERIERKRVKAFALFAGDGIGMDTKAAHGTAWGAYNAVVEAADYYGARKFRDEQRQAEELTRISADALFGQRADTKQRAFDACLLAAKGKLDFQDISPN